MRPENTPPNFSATNPEKAAQLKEWFSGCQLFDTTSYFYLRSSFTGVPAEELYFNTLVLIIRSLVRLSQDT